MRSQTNSQLEQLKNKVARDEHMEVGEHEDNENWQWIDVEITDHDPMGRSGIAADYAKTCGFNLCEVDFDAKTIRFNRQK